MSLSKYAFIIAIFCGSMLVGCSTNTIATKIEQIEKVESWTSPFWGYNTPKIVRNDKGELWTVSFMGKYGEEKAQIIKRDISGVWHKGKLFDRLYQPSMLFLDPEGRLNYIQNSQHEPMSHYRSANDENLNDFALVARGNGVEDGRGWYTGVGIHDSTMYLSYVTLTYDLFLTWKHVSDTSWHTAILLEPGLVDTTSGNHAWLYPRFIFNEGKGYITVSSCVDGSKYNTYDEVHLVTFSLANPAEFTKEIAFDGTVGYTSYSFDAIVTSNDKVVCGFNAGKYKYGEKKPDALAEGIYVAVKDKNGSVWNRYTVDEHSGSISLYEGADRLLYALIIRGSWDVETQVMLKQSADNGKTWTIRENNVLKDRPDIKNAFFGQILHAQSGSSASNGIDGVFSNPADTKPTKGMYSFDMLYLHIDLPN